ncbi:MAG: SAM-dependent methyltransferase [Betaproteobacteria bacterium HGW-Betaproteobacteria-22]|nr:MAG: SAM-dependent methyltransferase [Betaproteobacteria bacterium HGW-Betaproteobacteria-22]
MALGTLYFIPVTLGDDKLTSALPPDVISIAQKLELFVVENEKTARRFLGLINPQKPVRELQLMTLNEHTEEKAIPALLAPLLAGHDVGLMSEAGCPGIADPGAKLAALAHKKGIRVAPLVGPSAILLSLMASGLNGQRFSFLGYLPADKAARIQKLKEIEKQSRKNNETQIFIETPYRNQHLLEDILANCHNETQLCIACNISLEDEFIVTRNIHAWKNIKQRPDLQKKPAVFLLLA